MKLTIITSSTNFDGMNAVHVRLNAPDGRSREAVNNTKIDRFMKMQ